ncbi:helix-turn-helix transcriptional regulator [Allonocardiopsis opalescens]|uniref:Putative DNA-binding transcriptional regulator YafY n=1 Tax=Allonocardiopsis opalescens TaxID=1144618 RepID=A0A2T0Q552_9ACTN|nr:YafY family protein [Allonocardiopsis opalescens]PRX98903.1 putative DNA-binding transcriptional regulator YafY [Allonocardiopsis opalescens]
MTDTPGRLLALLSLLQTPRDWPGSELAERLEVSTRTIRRDVDRLRELGYPVEATLGSAGGYRLVAGTAMPPLVLDDEEAVAVAIGLRTATRQPVAGIEEASVRALTKLEQVLPSRLRHRVGALNAATVPMAYGGGPNVDPGDLSVLALAIAHGEGLRFGYVAADGRASQRRVEPYRLVAAERRWYLVAFDNDRDDWRVFRVDRVREPRATGARVTPREPPEPDAAAFVSGRMQAMRTTHRVVATLRLPAAEAVERGWFAAEDIEPVDAAHCRLDGHVDTLEWTAFALLRLGCEFTVHEPAELAAHLRELGGRAVRAAASG